MAYGTNDGPGKGPLTAQEVQDVTLSGFSKGESPHTNHPGTSYINATKKSSKREGHLTQVDHINSAIIAEINAMSWLEKMKMFNQAVLFEFLRSLSISDDEWEEAKKEGEEKLIQLIQRNNEAMDAQRIKEHLESLELRAQSTFLDDWGQLRRQAIWYQQAIAKEYVKLCDEHNIFLNEFHSVLDDIINDDSFTALPDGGQRKLIKARDDLKAYIDEDNSEDLRVLSETCLNPDGSINEEKIERQNESLERIKKKIKHVDDIYGKVLKAIGSHNTKATDKLKEVRERYEQKVAPILTKVSRLEELQKSIHLEKNTKIVDITHKCIGTVDILRRLENDNEKYSSDEYRQTKKEIHKLSELINDAVGSMLDGEISPPQYQKHLLFIQDAINSFYEEHKEKSLANNLEVDAMVAIQALRNNLTKVTLNNKSPVEKQAAKHKIKHSFQRREVDENNSSTRSIDPLLASNVEQKRDTTTEPPITSSVTSQVKPSHPIHEKQCTQRTSNLREELKEMVKTCEPPQPNLERAQQEPIDEEQEFDNTMLELIDPLEKVYRATFDEVECKDFTEICNLLNQYKERELTMDNILELEEKLTSCFDNLGGGALKIQLRNSWEEEKQEIIEDYDLSPNGPSA